MNRLTISADLFHHKFGGIELAVLRPGRQIDPRWLLLGVYPLILGFAVIYQTDPKARPFIFSSQILGCYILLCALIRMRFEVYKSSKSKTEGTSAYIKALLISIPRCGFFIALAAFVGVIIGVSWRTFFGVNV